MEEYNKLMSFDYKKMSINKELLFFYLIIIDIMFLPYFTLISVSFSVFLIIPWFILNYKKVKKDNEFAFFKLLIILMIISTYISLFYTQNLQIETSLLTSVKRLFQYIICFLYYFYFKNFFKHNSIDLKKIVLFFVFYVMIFAIFYRLLPLDYAKIKIAIHPVDNHTIRYLSNAVTYRFNYLWTDPNNVAYCFIGVVIWIITRNNISLFLKFVSVIIALFVTFSCMSNGGLIIALCMLLFLILKWLSEVFILQRINIKTIWFVIVVIVCLITLYNCTSLGGYIYDNFLLNNINRFNYYSNNNIAMGGRILDIKKTISLLSPLFLLIGSGKEGFSYEIGHFYWICMYGLPAYILFIRIVFYKYKQIKLNDYIFIVPFFIGFTLNIAIGEFKWMVILLMFVAYSKRFINKKTIIGGKV